MGSVHGAASQGNRLMQARKFETGARAPEIASLYGQCRDLLEGLDGSGLHQAAAHVSMALDVMRRSCPDLARQD
jgi:hypothetical protein